jgi:hypothetical protein
MDLIFNSMNYQKPGSKDNFAIFDLNAIPAVSNMTDRLHDFFF